MTMLTTSSANTSGGFQELSKGGLTLDLFFTSGGFQGLSKGGLRLDLFLPLMGSKNFLKKV